MAIRYGHRGARGRWRRMSANGWKTQRLQTVWTRVSAQPKGEMHAPVSFSFLLPPSSRRTLVRPSKLGVGILSNGLGRRQALLSPDNIEDVDHFISVSSVTFTGHEAPNTKGRGMLPFPSSSSDSAAVKHQLERVSITFDVYGKFYERLDANKLDQIQRSLPGPHGSPPFFTCGQRATSGSTTDGEGQRSGNDCTFQDRRVMQEELKRVGASPREIDLALHKGPDLLKELGYKVVAEAAGIVPSGVLTEWRRAITEHKGNLQQVADVLGLSEILPGQSGKDALAVFAVVLAQERRPDELQFAQQWLSLVFKPSVVILCEYNTARLAALPGTSVHVPANRTMTILRTFAAKAKRALPGRKSSPPPPSQAGTSRAMSSSARRVTLGAPRARTPPELESPPRKRARRDSPTTRSPGPRASR
ncbi:hypothetical protein B0H13DRAFT_2307964 [Mycena leptocephala]|nr:hypothetical protein B0H13DRAFT_2307964 [Mycena leptocephala]